MIRLLALNLFRRRSQTLLLFAFAAMTFFLYGMLLYPYYFLRYANGPSGERRVTTISQAGFAEFIPRSHAERIASLPGVRRVTYGAFLNSFYGKPSNDLTVYAVDPQTWIDTYSDTDWQVTAADRARFVAARDGLLVGEELARRFGWKTGDRVTLTTPRAIHRRRDGSSNWELTVSGVFHPRNPNVETGWAILHYDYFDALRQQGVGNIALAITTVASPEDKSGVARSIDRVLASTSAPTTTEATNEFFRNPYRQAVDVELVVRAGVVIVLAVFLTAACLSLSVFAWNRREETAVLRKLGFTSTRMGGLLFAEGIVPSVLGGVCGLLLSVSILRLAGLPRPAGVLQPFALGVALLVAVAFASFASLVPALILSRPRMPRRSEGAPALAGLAQRFGLTAAGMLPIALASAVLLTLLAMAQGFAFMLHNANASDIAIVLASRAGHEGNSTIQAAQVREVANLPGIARVDGVPQTSPELFAVAAARTRMGGLRSNITLRGMSSTGLELRPGTRIVAGRLFRPGADEVIVGRNLQRKFAGFDYGAVVHFGAASARVVGVFVTDGNVFESEIWGDTGFVQRAFDRGNTFQSVRVRLSSAGAVQELESALHANPGLNLDVRTENAYYTRQIESTRALLVRVGWLAVAVLSLGAAFAIAAAAMVMVAARTREIATLRAIGFRRGSVLARVVLPSWLAGVAAVFFAVLAVHAIFDGFAVSTLGASRTSVVFDLRLSTSAILQATVFAAAICAIAIGIVWSRTSRASISDGLRA